MTATTPETDTEGPDAAETLGQRLNAELSRRGHEFGQHLYGAQESSLRNRLRPHYTPWTIALAVGGVAVVGNLFAAAYGPEVAHGIAAAAWAVLAATVLVVWRRLPLGERVAAFTDWARQRPRWLGICGAVAACWLTLALVLGAEHALVLAVAWLCGLYGCAARWWRENRIPYPDPWPEQHVDIAPEEPAEDTGPEDEPDEVVERWNTYLSCSGGRLTGAVLEQRRDTPVGRRYRLRLVPGKQTYEHAVNATPYIAGGLGVPAENLVIEKIPATKQVPHPDPNLLDFQVITNSPLKPEGHVELTAPNNDPEQPVIWLGPYADGVSWAPWRLYSKNSAWGGFIIGGMGSGKSGMLEAIALGAMNTGNTVVWYLDGQEGASSPLLCEESDWAVTRSEDWQAFTTAVESIIYYRGQENRSLGVSGFTPGPERPGLMVVVDECHELWSSPKIAARWGRMARISRKVGVGIIGASQEYTVKTFGNDRALRAAMAKGNLIVMRTTESVDAQLIPGFDASPAQLKELPGYGYRVAAAGEGRTAPFRAAWAPSTEKDTDVPDTSTEAMMHRTPRAHLDDIAVAAAGEAYHRRYESNEASQQQVEAELTQLLAHGPRREEPEAAARSLDFSDFPASFIPEDLLAETPKDAPTEAAPEDTLSFGQRAVLDALAKGISNISEVSRSAGINRSAVYKALSVLEGKGLVRRQGGTFVAEDTDRAANLASHDA